MIAINGFPTVLETNNNDDSCKACNALVSFAHKLTLNNSDQFLDKAFISICNDYSALPGQQTTNLVLNPYFFSYLLYFIFMLISISLSRNFEIHLFILKKKFSNFQNKINSMTTYWKLKSIECWHQKWFEINCNLTKIKSNKSCIQFILNIMIHYIFKT